jgi:hypothetical protein
MKLPYLMTCRQPHALLYQLADGRFQIMESGSLAPMMVGYEYVLVEEALAEYLEFLDLPRVDTIPAIIYEPRQRLEIRTYRQLIIGQRFSPDMIRDLDLEGERLLLMGNQDVFASVSLKQRLEESPFTYLGFSEGLSSFAGVKGSEPH